MPKFKITQCETHTSEYIVEGKDEVDALIRFHRNPQKGQFVDNSTEYVEINEDIGISLENSKFSDEEVQRLKEARVLDADYSFIPGIEGIEWEADDEGAEASNDAEDKEDENIYDRTQFEGFDAEEDHDRRRGSYGPEYPGEQF